MKHLILSRHKRFAFGTALTEYGLVGAFGILLAGASFTLIGTGLNTNFSQLLSDFISHRDKAKIAMATIPSINPSAAASSTSGDPPTLSTLTENEVNTNPPTASNPTLPGNMKISFTTANGSNITIDNYPNTPLSQNVSTNGANGATQILANTIETMAEQLKSSGTLSTQQYNTLMALANQGHRLGELAGLSEQAAALGRSGSNYLTLNVKFDGENISVRDLGNMIGYSIPSNAGPKFDNSTGSIYTTMPKDPLNPTYGAQGELQSFLDLYHQAERSGALNDPNINKIISSLSSQIALINESVDQAQGAVYVQMIAGNAFREQAASSLTHEKSATICTTGGGQDSGVQCSKAFSI